MACGTPVAAFPVAGPIDVVGRCKGGVLDEDLRAAALRSLGLLREGARARALQFDWGIVCRQFIDYLVPARRALASLPISDAPASGERWQPAKRQRQ